MFHTDAKQNSDQVCVWIVLFRDAFHNKDDKRPETAAQPCSEMHRQVKQLAQGCTVRTEVPTSCLRLPSFSRLLRQAEVTAGLFSSVAEPAGGIQ